MAEPDEATISYSSIAFVLGLAFIIYRYFSTSSSETSPASGSRPQGQRYTESQLDQVTAMFPQMSRRDIAWDLQRNRGNVNATVERVLGGRGLDVAPPSFQIVLPAPPTTSTSTTTSTLSTLLSGKKAEPDLITRYKLQDRINASDKGKGVEGGQPGSWASTKTERAEVLKRRRDEMILEARRKMLERDAAEES